MGQFYYAAKAFDMLERLDPNPEYWEGKRGAACGHFQLVIAGKEERQVKKMPMGIGYRRAHPFSLVRIDVSGFDDALFKIITHKIFGEG